MDAMQNTGIAPTQPTVTLVPLDRIAEVLERAEAKLAEKTLEYCFLEAESGKTYMVDKVALAERRNQLLKSERYVAYLRSLYESADLSNVLSEDSEDEGLTS